MAADPPGGLGKSRQTRCQSRFVAGFYEVVTALQGRPEPDRDVVLLFWLSVSLQH